MNNLIKRTLNKNKTNELNYYFLSQKDLEKFKETHNYKFVFQIRDKYNQCI